MGIASKLGIRSAAAGLGLACALLGGVALGAPAPGVAATAYAPRIDAVAQAPGALDALAPYLAHQDARVRAEAARALARVADPGVYLALAELSRDRDVGVRAAAVEVLAADSADLAVGALARFLGDSAPGIRGQALVAMGSVRSKTAIVYLGEVSTHRDSAMRREAIALLESQARGEHRDAVAQALLPYLADPQMDLRVAAVTGLGRTGDPALIEQVARLYESPHLPLRLAAVDTLRQTWDKRAAEALLAFTGDPAEGVRSKTYASLARMGGASSFDALVAKGLEDPSWEVRLEVASHVADLRLSQAVPGIVAAVQGAEMELKRPLIEELNRMGTADSRAALIQLNQEGSPYERLLVAKIVTEQRTALVRAEEVMWEKMTDTGMTDGEVRRFVNYDPSYGVRDPVTGEVGIPEGESTL